MKFSYLRQDNYLVHWAGATTAHGSRTISWILQSFSAERVAQALPPSPLTQFQIQASRQYFCLAETNPRRTQEQGSWGNEVFAFQTVQWREEF